MNPISIDVPPARLQVMLVFKKVNPHRVWTIADKDLRKAVDYYNTVCRAMFNLIRPDDLRAVYAIGEGPPLNPQGAMIVHSLVFHPEEGVYAVVEFIDTNHGKACREFFEQGKLGASLVMLGSVINGQVRDPVIRGVELGEAV